MTFTYPWVLYLGVLPALEIPGRGVTVEVAVPAAKAVLAELRTMPPATARAPIRLTMLSLFTFHPGKRGGVHG